MTTLLDSYAVLAYLKGEQGHDEVADLLHSGRCVMSTVGMVEAVDHLVRIVGASEDDAALDLGQLGLLDEPIEVDLDIALLAGRLRGRHYHRTTRAVSLADCVLAASARLRDATMVTSDPHLLDLCVDESIAYVVLPGSASTWSP